MLLNTYGAGKTIWFAGCIESRGEYAQDAAFIQSIDYLTGGEYAVSLAAPPAIEAVCFRQKDGVIVSLLNTQTTLPPVTAHGVTVTVSLDGRKADSVILVPSKEKLPYTENDGKVTFEAPPLTLFQMFKVVTKE
jgi:hypothetical protein